MVFTKACRGRLVTLSTFWKLVLTKASHRLILTVFVGRFNWRDQQRLAVSYFSEYSTDFSVSNSSHEVLRRTVKDSKTGFEKRTVASSVCCFVGARVNVSKPVKGEREPLTEAGLVKE